MTASRLIDLAAVCAILAGLLFAAIQPLHPPDTLASVTTSAWAAIHYASIVMLVLFGIGITGIYAAQLERMGWLGLAGYAMLMIGLLLTAAGDVLEAFVQPLLASSEPLFVQGMLNLVEGRPTEVDLGAIPLLWNLSSAGFVGGTILFGAANFRARVLSRWASAIFAVGLFLSAPLVSLLSGGGAPRLAALPISLGLAWLGYSLLTRHRRTATQTMSSGAASQPGATTAA